MNVSVFGFLKKKKATIICWPFRFLLHKTKTSIIDKVNYLSCSQRGTYIFSFAKNLSPIKDLTFLNFKFVKTIFFINTFFEHLYHINSYFGLHIYINTIHNYKYYNINKNVSVRVDVLLLIIYFNFKFYFHNVI